MSKRFTSSSKWNDPWYRKLPTKYKFFWQYVCDQCDNAGVWKVDFEAASFHTGEKYESTECLAKMNDGKDRIMVSLDGASWCVVGFIYYQLGKIKRGNNFHESVLDLIHKYAAAFPSPIPYREHDKIKTAAERVKDLEGKPYVISTPGQEIVSIYKMRTGVDLNDRAWDHEYYPRFKKDAELLLRFFKGDVGAAGKCVIAVADYMEKRELDWNLGTVRKRASDWQTGRLYKK
jgi:hypothetical protein